uniref:LIM domain-containing protein 1 n=1 Tax=Latimeria chalumnae TaxID=7897 RepID=H2ZYD4_LATCH
MDKYEDLGLEASKFIEDLNMYEASRDGLFRVPRDIGNNPEFEETRRVFASKMNKIHLQRQELANNLAGGEPQNGGVGGNQPLNSLGSKDRPPLNNNLFAGESAAKPPLAAFGPSNLANATQYSLANQQPLSDLQRTRYPQEPVSNRRASYENTYDNLDNLGGSGLDHRGAPPKSPSSATSLPVHAEPLGAPQPSSAWGGAQEKLPNSKPNLAGPRASLFQNEQVPRSPSKLQTGQEFQYLHPLSPKRSQAEYGGQNGGSVSQSNHYSGGFDQKPIGQRSSSFSHTLSSLSPSGSGFNEAPTGLTQPRSSSFSTPPTYLSHGLTSQPNKNNTVWSGTVSNPSSLRVDGQALLSPSKGSVELEHPYHITESSRLAQGRGHGQDQVYFSSMINPGQELSADGQPPSSAPVPQFRDCDRSVPQLESSSNPEIPSSPPPEGSSAAKVKLPCQTLLLQQEKGPSAAELKLEAITKRLEQEMDAQPKAEYFGTCVKCSKGVYGANQACQAMGNLYHDSCFTCSACSRRLRGKAFYFVNGKVFCEEDFLYSGFQQSADKCFVCGHLIMDMLAQFLSCSVLPLCLVCVLKINCSSTIEFLHHLDRRLFCCCFYEGVLAPKCASCGLPILPSEGSDETIRVVSMDKDYHVECYHCEDCGMELNDEEGCRCYPLNEHLLCHACHLKHLDNGTVPSAAYSHHY